MIKTKQKNIQLPLVITGYVLFALLVIATLLSTTIPFGLALFNPRVMHVNVTVLVITFTLGALLPAALGYVIGDRSVKTKSKLSHHFTGVLFGLLAYWVMMLLSAFIPYPQGFYEANQNVSLIIVNTIPSIGVAVLSSIIAIAHVRSRHAKKSILEYKPFTLALMVAIVALPLGSLIHNIFTNSVGVHSFIAPAILIVAGIISYLTLHQTKLRHYEKVVWSAVAVSVLSVALFVVPQFVFATTMYLIPQPTMEVQTIENWAGYALAFFAWGLYWFKQVRAMM